jgi:hypothetical protein
MSPLLFHRRLSQHPTLPTPEGSSRLHSRVFAASVAFACVDELGSLFSPFGPTFRCCKLHVMLRAALLHPFRRGYVASAHPVAQMHWTPATWPSGSYHDWTCTSKPTMTFRTHQCRVRPHENTLTFFRQRRKLCISYSALLYSLEDQIAEPIRIITC